MSHIRQQTSNRIAPQTVRATLRFGRVMLGAALWAVLMALSAWYGVSALDWEMPGRVTRVVLLFAAGAFAAFPIAALGIRLARAKRREAAFAAAFVSLAAATASVTALIFAFDYRTYYAEWHDDTFSVRLIFEIIFTTLSAFYQFAVLGLRLYFPVGFVGLFVASWWFARSRD